VLYDQICAKSAVKSQPTNTTYLLSSTSECVGSCNWQQWQWASLMRRNYSFNQWKRHCL